MLCRFLLLCVAECEAEKAQNFCSLLAKLNGKIVNCHYSAIEWKDRGNLEAFLLISNVAEDAEGVPADTDCVQ